MSGFRKIYGLLILVGMTGLFAYFSFQQWRTAPAAPQPILTPQERAIAAVEAKIGVPKGERPSVEHVSGTSFLQSVNPLFYAETRDGDWLLHYPSLIVIYREEGDRVIKTSPVLKP